MQANELLLNTSLWQRSVTSNGNGEKWQPVERRIKVEFEQYHKTTNIRISNYEMKKRKNEQFTCAFTFIRENEAIQQTAYTHTHTHERISFVYHFFRSINSECRQLAPVIRICYTSIFTMEM